MASHRGATFVIRTYQAEHGGPIFDSARTRRRRVQRNRMMALAVIVAIAASAGVLQHFNDNLAPSGPMKSGSGVYSAAR
jgi:hypothetical protein